LSIEIFTFIITLVLGLLIGFEREYHARNKGVPVIAGVRTFTLISILGFFISFYFSKDDITYFAGIGILFCVFLSTLLIKQKVEDPGMTTSVSIILMFLIGLSVGAGYLTESIIIGLAIFSLNYSKRRLHYFADLLDQEELMSALRFLSVIAIFIPLAYTIGSVHPLIGPGRVFDTVKFLLMIVFVSTISFISYLITKIIGTSKGLKIIAFVGGFVSSAASTASMSEKLKKNPKMLNTIFGSILITNTSMVLKSLIILMVMAGTGLAFPFLWPVFVFISVTLVFVLYRKGKYMKETHKIDLGTPFAIIPAAKFASLYILISVFTYFAKTYLGPIGIYATSIGGVVSTTSVTASMASMYTAGEISGNIALTTLLFSVLLGTVSKILIVRTFDKNLAKKLILPFSLISIIIFITALSLILT
ncbi:MAG: MgtC/SapB family protein, partial [Thermoplasmatota archaeon]